MTTLSDTFQAYVDDGTLVGAVAVVARGDDAEVVATGFVDVEGTAPMRRDSIFRIASLTKPVIGAAAMLLVQDGAMALDDPVERWLPELSARRVLRSYDAELSNTVPSARPVTAASGRPPPSVLPLTSRSGSVS